MLRSNYITNEYMPVYKAIDKYFTRYGNLPSFESLLVSVDRNSNLTDMVQTLDSYKDVNIDVIAGIEALENQYTQDALLLKLDKLLDNLVLLDSEEIKQELNTIVNELEDSTNNSSTICLMNDIKVVRAVDDHSHEYVPLGFNNDFDANVRAFTSDLIMLGGYRGSGKSIICSNIVVNQYNQGNVGLYFSIEMPRGEVFDRILSTLSHVSHDRFRKEELTSSDLDIIAKVRSDMFSDSEDVYGRYLEDKDFEKFEDDLLRNYALRQDKQIIIVDNQRMTLSDVDMAIHKVKSKFGDRLKVVVVDYVNQLEIDDMYNWKQQIMLSKQLKNFARKHEVVLFTPYQIDKSGEARFARGILDAADMAMNIEAKDDYITVTSTKVRGTEKFSVHSKMEWEYLKVDPTPYVPPAPVKDDEEEPTKKKKDTSEELPW